MPPLLVEHFLLQRNHTLASPHKTRFWGEVRNVHDLSYYLDFAEQHQLPLQVIGDGSNVVLSQDWPGLIIHMVIVGREIIRQDNELVWLRLGAGENWHSVVSYCLMQQWYGLEPLALIPGTVGAAPIQNIGAYGTQLESLFDHLEAYDRETKRLVRLNASDCQFAYRDSIFKTDRRNRYIITAVILKLWRTPKTLDTLVNYDISPEQSPQEIYDSVVGKRKMKLPDPANMPNAGSFFKNPVISAKHYQRLRTQCAPHQPPVTHVKEGVRVAAGWLLEYLGWKGYRHNGVGTWREHALIIVNPGYCKGQTILALGQQIQASAQQQLGIELHIEPDVI